MPLIAFILVTSNSYAKDITLTESFAGNLSFELTGGGIRRGSDGCSQPFASSTAQLSTPVSSRIEAAFLYWSGSGSSTSYNSISMNGSTIYASEFYTVADSDGLQFYSAKADVTSRISSGSSNVTITNLKFDRSGEHCSFSTAYGGWALVVIYEEASEPLRVINVFDGLQVFWGSEIQLTPSNFVVADNPGSLGGKHAHITWEGDSGNSQSKNNVNETLRFKNNSLYDASNPINNQFNSYSNSRSATTNGADIDVYDIGNYLTAGETSVTTRYSSGQDQVLLSAEVISVPNRAVSDLSLQVAGPADIYRGQTVAYTFTVANNGPGQEPSGATVSFPLQDMGFLGASGTNWNCAVVSASVECAYTSAITENTSAATLTITLSSHNSTTSSYTLAAEVIADNFDHRSANNKSSVVTQINAPVYDLTKTGVGLNSSVIRAGDTLRYTFNITNNSGSAIFHYTVCGQEIALCWRARM